jgi:hypothetical protein
MEQEYILKREAGLSLFEIAFMSAEDRLWWLRRIKEDREKEKDAAKTSQNTPRMPSVPRIRR